MTSAVEESESLTTQSEQQQRAEEAADTGG